MNIQEYNETENSAMSFNIYLQAPVFDFGRNQSTNSCISVLHEV